ncbi:MAG: tetratricopeptide repeat protein [Bacteroidota bacterium]
MKSILFCTLAVLAHTAEARLQGQARIDSLLRQLPAASADTNKVLLLNDLAQSYKNIDPGKGIAYAKQQLQLATVLGWKRGEALAYHRLGVNSQYRYDYNKAIEYDQRALELYQLLNDKGGVAGVEMSLANINSQMGNHAKGLEYDLKALRIFEELHDKRNIAITQGNIGNIYQVMGRHREALAYDLQALKIFEELDDRSGVARNLANVGNVYLLLGDAGRALDYNRKALGMFEELGEKHGQGTVTGNIGEIYFAIAADSTGRLSGGPGIPKNKQEALRLAIDHLEKGVIICRQISMLGGVAEFSSILSKAHKLAGNYQQALYYARQRTSLQDSLFSQETIQKISMIDERKGRELSEKALEVQRLQLRATRNERRYYIAGLALLVFVSAGLFRSFRSARRNKEQLEEKNRLIAIEKENADMLRHRAERSEQFQQQFLANMSHEIRTPMNAVNGMTDLLLDKNPRPDQLRYLQIIAKSSDILLHIINDILDLSKIESGKLELESIDFLLEDTIRQVKETLSFRAEEKGVQLISKIDAAIPDVLLGDPFRLNQILINLGSNAIKFTERGSVTIEVKPVTNTAGHVSLQFHVTDTGIGIPADKMDKLFHSFKQVHSSDSRVYGGSGLGLSISRQLIELQRGEITVSSTVGVGSTFSFELSYPVGSAERLREKMLEEQKAEGSVLNGLRILLVDDNEFNRMVAAETLRLRAKVHIEEAINGEEAVKMLQANDYDVLLMDIQMPVMDGLEATKYIRSNLAAPKRSVPIVALTASLLRGNIEMCTAAGMDSYVPKPFKAWQLIAALAEVTGRKGAKVKGERVNSTPTKVPA